MFLYTSILGHENHDEQHGSCPEMICYEILGRIPT